MNKEMKRGYISSILMSLIMGLQYIFIKNVIQLADNNVFLVLTCRFLVALGVFLLILLFTRKKASLTPLKNKHMLTLSILHPVINFTLQTIGVMLTPVLVVSILIALIPIVNVLIGRFLLKEKLTKRQILLILLSAAGSLLVSISQIVISHNRMMILGILLILASITSRGFYSAKSRQLSGKFSSEEITLSQLITGALCFSVFLLVSILFNPITDFRQIVLNRDFLYGILYLALLATVAVFYLNNFALSKLSVSNMGLLNSLTALVSTLAGVLVLKEKLTLYHIVGFTLIIISTLLYNRKPGNKNPKSS